MYHLLLLYCSYNTANVSVVQPPPCIPPYSFISELILSIIQINPNTLYSYTFSSYNPIAILLYTPLRTLIAFIVYASPEGIFSPPLLATCLRPVCDLSIACLLPVYCLYFAVFRLYFAYLPICMCMCPRHPVAPGYVLSVRPRRAEDR